MIERPGTQPTPWRVGVDLVHVDEVADSVRRFGSRYLERVYTHHELACAAGPPEVQAARLAARFAAKEAALKVLEPQGPRPDWRTIEVRRAPHGPCRLHLFGSAASLARHGGIGQLAVSLTHEADLAAAVVVATATAVTGLQTQLARALATFTPIQGGNDGRQDP